MNIEERNFVQELKIKALAQIREKNLHNIWVEGPRISIFEAEKCQNQI